MRNITDVISATVRQQFPEDAIDHVDVSEGEDSDGDRILKVTIVLNTGLSALDQNKMIGLVRHIRTNLLDHLSESGERQDVRRADFPLISYVSKQEYSKLSSAAA